MRTIALIVGAYLVIAPLVAIALGKAFVRARKREQRAQLADIAARRAERDFRR